MFYEEKRKKIKNMAAFRQNFVAKLELCGAQASPQQKLLTLAGMFFGRDKKGKNMAAFRQNFVAKLELC